jgi:hypothetical protein
MEHTHLDEPKLQALPTGDHDDTHKEKEHDHFLGSISNVLGPAIIGFLLAPFGLREIGIGAAQAKLDQGSACCSIIKEQANNNKLLAIDGFLKPINGKTLEDSKVYGIAGVISGALSYVPCGDQMFKLEKQILEAIPFSKRKTDGSADIDDSIHPLARGGVMNMLVGVALIAGAYGFNYLEKIEKNYFVEQAKKKGASADELAEIAENAGGISRAGKLVAQTAGALTLAPPILAGIGHTSLSLSTTAGWNKINYKEGTGDGPFSTFAAVLGKNPGPCPGDRKMTTGAAAVLTSQLCCIAPALFSSVPMLFSHTNTTENKLPEGIKPYRKQDHELMPNIEKLAQLTDAEIEQRIKDNTYHIADTEAAQQRTATLRNIAKVGAGAAAAFTTFSLSNKFLNNKFNKVIDKVDNLSKNMEGYSDWHGIEGMYHETTGEPYELIKFLETDEAKIKNNIKLPYRKHEDYQRFQAEAITLRGAHCALPAVEGANYMLDCLPRNVRNDEGELSNCCPTTMINSKIVDELASLAKTTKNRALLSGVAGAAVGAGVYKLVENFLDKADNNIIHPLKHENFVLKSIQAGRNNIVAFERGAVHQGKIAEQPLAIAANIK